MRWVSTRADLPKARVWIGPYQSSPGSGEPTIQISDAHDDSGQGEGGAIGELASESARRRLLAECLADRQKEEFHDPEFHDDGGLGDEADDGRLRVCGEPHPTGSHGHCTLPPGHTHHVHQTASGPAAVPDIVRSR
ncbi:hypothetical protein [Thermomonospora umbrina]|uniref:Uncharacterized protein n=1 Tax=Thermomonospora umbrina TaxID=111806 RepID=A0A3D9TAF6_9ACTN|nr:hypothetical protein [Thermomonospora umbrina]REF00752.1 hypothetical protein DFJ69_6331 [Thermomonospora umbrina]